MVGYVCLCPKEQACTCPQPMFYAVCLCPEDQQCQCTSPKTDVVCPPCNIQVVEDDMWLWLGGCSSEDEGDSTDGEVEEPPRKSARVETEVVVLDDE